MIWWTAGLHAASGIVALLFAREVGQSFRRRRAPSSLCWFVALVLFALTALADAAAAVVGWTPWLYRLWYVGAAWLVAAFGAGTAYLVLPRPWAHAILGLLAAVGLAMLGVAAATPVDLAALAGGGPVGGEGWTDATVRVFSPLLTIPGSLLLLGGAVVGVVLLISDVLYGGSVVVGFTVGIAGVFVVLWYGIPLFLRLTNK